MAQTSELTTPKGYHHQHHHESSAAMMAGSNYDAGTLTQYVGSGNLEEGNSRSSHQVEQTPYNSIFNATVSRLNQVYPSRGVSYNHPHHQEDSQYYQLHSVGAAGSYLAHAYNSSAMNQQYYNPYYGWATSLHPVTAAGNSVLNTNTAGVSNNGGNTSARQPNHFNDTVTHDHPVQQHDTGTPIYPQHQHSSTPALPSNNSYSSAILPHYDSPLHQQFTLNQTQPSCTIQHHATPSSPAPPTLQNDPPLNQGGNPSPPAPISNTTIPDWTHSTNDTSTTGYLFVTREANSVPPTDHNSSYNSYSTSLGGLGPPPPTDDAAINESSYSLTLKEDSPNSSTGIDGPLGAGVVSDNDEAPIPPVQHREKPTGAVTGPSKDNRYSDTSGIEPDDDVDSFIDSPNNNNDEETETKKPKRTRTAFTAQQLDQLELYFSQSNYPDAFTRDEIARHLHIKEDRIQVWFQNRRARQRKQERTGSVSIRSRTRQQRVQRLKDAQMFYGYSTVSISRGNRMVSPQTPQSHSAIPQFSFQPSTSLQTSESPPLHSSVYQLTGGSTTALSHPPVPAVPVSTSESNGLHYSSLTSINSNDQ